MPRAVWNGVVIAESETTEVVDGDHYFPPDAVKREFLVDSETKSTCPWKGTASYYHVAVDGDINTDAAFCYPDPSAAAENIRDHVAFWKGVKIED